MKKEEFEEQSCDDHSGIKKSASTPVFEEDNVQAPTPKKSGWFKKLSRSTPSSRANSLDPSPEGSSSQSREESSPGSGGKSSAVSSRSTSTLGPRGTQSRALRNSFSLSSKKNFKFGFNALSGNADQSGQGVAEHPELVFTKENLPSTLSRAIPMSYTKKALDAEVKLNGPLLWSLTKIIPQVLNATLTFNNARFSTHLLAIICGDEDWIFKNVPNYLSEDAPVSIITSCLAMGGQITLLKQYFHDTLLKMLHAHEQQQIECLDAIVGMAALTNHFDICEYMMGEIGLKMSSNLFFNESILLSCELYQQRHFWVKIFANADESFLHHVEPKQTFKIAVGMQEAQEHFNKNLLQTLSISPIDFANQFNDYLNDKHDMYLKTQGKMMVVQSQIAAFQKHLLDLQTLKKPMKSISSEDKRRGGHGPSVDNSP